MRAYGCTWAATSEVPVSDEAEVPNDVAVTHVARDDEARPLTVAERYLVETSTEVAFTRRRREIALSEADAARAELVGCEYRALALAHEARRARMPRTLPPRATHGDMRQAADGHAGPIGAGEVPRLTHRPREEMSAAPPPDPPTWGQRFLGWVTGRPPAPPAPMVLQSYAVGDLPPGQRDRAGQTDYSLDLYGLAPQKKATTRPLTQAILEAAR